MVRDPITTRKSRWKLILGVIAVYGMGVVTGVLGLVMLVAGAAKKQQGDPEPLAMQRFFVNQLDRKLKLTPEQRDEVSAIVKDILAEMGPIRDDTRQRVVAVIRAHDPRFREVLDGRQEALYEEYLRGKGREWKVAFQLESKAAPEPPRQPDSP